MTNRDYRDLFFEFNAAEVRYLIVGAYAVSFHTRPRYTKDIDIWIDPSQANAQRAWRALARFGAPTGSISPADLQNRDSFFQIGVEPNRIDILTSVADLDFETCWSRRELSTYDDCEIAYLSRVDLIASKRAAGRPKDLRDLRWLENDPH